MRHAVDRPSGLNRSRNAVQATFGAHAGSFRSHGEDAGAPRAVRERGRRPGPPPWSGPPSGGKGTCHRLHDGGGAGGSTGGRRNFVERRSAGQRRSSRRHSGVSGASASRLTMGSWGGNCRRADRCPGCRRHWSAGYNARNCAVWATISAGKRPMRTFRHAPNTSDHHWYGQSVECVTDRGLCRCWPQRVWLLRGTVRRLEPNNDVWEEPQGGDEPCVVVCVVSRSPRSR